MPYVSQLRAAIEDAGRAFEPNELAFLALTSKIERPIVDRVAYRLFSTLRPSQKVGREWPLDSIRVDLAILEQESPKVLLEAKAMGTSDCTRPGNRGTEYPGLLQRDLDRFKGKEVDSDIFSLLLAVHPKREIPRDLKKIVKYASGMNTALRTPGGEAGVRARCQENLKNSLIPGVPCHSDFIPGGCAFGIEVDVLWWLFGPFSAPGNLQILR